jgi:hypothetical protein
MAYAVGAKDTLKGTGVWSFIELKREKKDEEKADATAASTRTAR